MEVFILLFVFMTSVASAAAGFLVSNHLKKALNGGFIPWLEFFQIFTFTFGFYGLWGQFIVEFVLSLFVDDNVSRISAGISMLLGIPFLVVAGYMFLRLVSNLSGYLHWRKGGWLYFPLIGLSFVTTGIVYKTEITTLSLRELIIACFVTLETLVVLWAAFVLFFPGKGRRLIRTDRYRLIGGLLVTWSFNILLIWTYHSNSWSGLAFLFLYFPGKLLFPIYLNYLADRSPFLEKETGLQDFDEFCKQYEISPRESEIILEICTGKTNKEIADKLFISLQTVKDHTHRIYLKTGVKNRTLLARLVKEKTNA